MATRATYKFVGNNRQPTVTFYIHHDGYPQGAAAHLRDAALAACKGTMAEKFLRANEHAELTYDHDQHGDTDYRWTIDGSQITGQVRCVNEKRQETYRGCYFGDLVQFINEYSGEDPVCWLGNRIYNRAALEEIVTARLAYATQHSTAGHHGNASSIVSDAWRTLSAILQHFGDSDFTERARCAIDAFDAHHAKAFGWVRGHGTEEEAVKAWKRAFRETEKVAA